MLKQITLALIIAACLPVFFIACNQSSNTLAPALAAADSAKAGNKYGGYTSREEWGEHIVNISGCNDCHTPKKMGPHGPENDSDLLLSGHPAEMPPPDVDRKMAERKGLAVSNTLTAWVGPWGISYAANLTSDSTGIGNWTEEQFFKCLRNDKWMGLDNGRPLLPPMPWENLKNMTDDELKAVFAYLKATRPIHNIVPQAAPPLMALK